MKTNYESMTDEEFDLEIEKKYGKDWKPPKYDEQDPLSVEWWRRASTAN